MSEPEQPDLRAGAGGARADRRAARARAGAARRGDRALGARRGALRVLPRRSSTPRRARSRSSPAASSSRDRRARANAPPRARPADPDPPQSLSRHLGLVRRRHNAQHREREPSRARKSRPTPIPTDASIACSPKPYATPVLYADAVAGERRRDRDLHEPDVARPEREDGHDVHQQQDDAGGRQRRVDVERAHRGVDGEELARPADDLEEDRGPRRAGERITPSPARPIASSRRSGPSPSIGIAGEPARRDEREDEEADAEADHEDQGRARRGRDARRGDDVEDEQEHRDDVEDAVREHRPDERRPRSLAPGHLPRENGDPRELADAPRQHGVREQADRERREDERYAGARRLHRRVDHRRPGERARDDREEVQPIATTTHSQRTSLNAVPIAVRVSRRHQNRPASAARTTSPRKTAQDPADGTRKSWSGSTHPRHYRRRPVRLRSPHDREIVRLALPALGALAAEPLYVLVDTAIVGHLGRPQIAALGLAGIVSPGRSRSSTSSPTGRRPSSHARRARAGRTTAARLAAQALWVSLGIGVALLVVLEVARGAAAPGTRRARAVRRVRAHVLPDRGARTSGRAHRPRGPGLPARRLEPAPSARDRRRRERRERRARGALRLRLPLGHRRLGGRDGDRAGRHGRGVRRRAAAAARALEAAERARDAADGADRAPDLRPHGGALRLVPRRGVGARADGRRRDRRAPDRVPALPLPRARARRGRDRRAGDRRPDARRRRRRRRVRRRGADDRLVDRARRRLRGRALRRSSHACRARSPATPRCSSRRRCSGRSSR